MDMLTLSPSRLACSLILKLGLMTTPQSLIQKNLEVRSTFFLTYKFPILWHHLIDDFIDNVPDISPASGSETQPTVSWNTFEERNQDLDGFLDELYQRSQSRRTAHNTTTSDDDDDFPIHELVNNQDFPLWRICCQVSFWFILKIIH